MEKYSKRTIVIHWASFFLIALMIISGKYNEELKGSSFDSIKLHGMLGVVVALLTITRAILHFRTKRPTPLKTNSGFRDNLIVGVQYLFYAVLIILSLTGVVMMLKGGYLNAILSDELSFALDEETCHGLHIHRAMVKVFMVLFFAHIGGVISYVIKFKHNIFKRIF